MRNRCNNITLTHDLLLHFISDYPYHIFSNDALVDIRHIISIVWIHFYKTTEQLCLLDIIINFLLQDSSVFSYICWDPFILYHIIHFQESHISRLVTFLCVLKIILHHKTLGLPMCLCIISHFKALLPSYVYNHYFTFQGSSAFLCDQNSLHFKALLPSYVIILYFIFQDSSVFLGTYHLLYHLGSGSLCTLFFGSVHIMSSYISHWRLHVIPCGLRRLHFILIITYNKSSCLFESILMDNFICNHMSSFRTRTFIFMLASHLLSFYKIHIMISLSRHACISIISCKLYSRDHLYLAFIAIFAFDRFVFVIHY